MPKRLPLALTPDETDALRRVLRPKSLSGLRNRALIEAMLGAGLRVSELVALKGADVDIAEGTIRVNRGKGAKDRVVPVLPESLPWLQLWAEKRAVLGLNGRDPFFCHIRRGTGWSQQGTGAPLTPRYIQLLVKRLATQAGLEGKPISPHTLRHTYATHCLRRGLSVRDVQTLLGHSRLETTSIYTHIDPQELKAKVQALQQPAAPDLTALLQALQIVLAALPEEQWQQIQSFMSNFKEAKLSK